MSHSPEPWTLYPGRNNLYLDAIMEDPRGYHALMQKVFYIAGAKHKSDFVADVITSFNSTGDANARRIVACVNACQDLDTEFLESHRLYCDEDGIQARGIA